MPLVIRKFTFEQLMDLMDNPCPECELEKMSPKQIRVLVELIDAIVHEFRNDLKQFAKLMRLKSFVMLHMN